MFKGTKVKFFLVAAILIAGASLAGAEESFDWGGDPNGEIGVPGTSVVDNALETVPVNCHDCEIAARSGTSRGQLFEPRGSASASKTDDNEAKQ